ncbi:hypothetical protein ACFL5R_01855 [Pseudomonadota bacterium]
MKYEWTLEKLAAKGAEFILSVINNMGSGARTTVRFGTEGSGEMPNYQVDKTIEIWGQERKVTELYQSRSHKQLNTTLDEFSSDNLSRSFSLAEMLELSVK